MDSSPAWRRIAFAVIVCILVALGAYLIGPVAHQGRRSGQTPAAATTPRPRASAPPAPAATVSPSAAAPDIYQWLPFTPAGLAAAASVASRFGDAYGTYSYTQSAAAYGATLQPVSSGALVEQIEGAYSAPGVASARTGGKQVAAGLAAISSISAFGPTSLTFQVQVAQRITGTAGASQVSTDYAVTLTGGGTTWQVTSIELASVGNS
jgi:hypothetical protein